MADVRLEIVSYRPEHQPWFEKFNRDWIEKHFWMEPVDIQVLQHPDEHIIDNGGFIFMALYNREIAGTVALKFSASGVYEFTKMAVDERFRGKKIGLALAQAAISKAREMGARKIILYSNTILQRAIELYRKLGFREIPVDGPYKRSNIKMELILKSDFQNSNLTIRICSIKDIDTIIRLGKQTFSETFADVNTPENMQLYLEGTFKQEKLVKEFQEEGAVFFMAEFDNRAIGFAKVRTSEKPEGLLEAEALEIERLYVIKEAIGRNVGKVLMETCLSHARDNGYKVVWLGVWEHNERALQFYKKFGFEKFGQHIFMLGNDAQTDLLMQKKLN